MQMQSKQQTLHTSRPQILLREHLMEVGLFTLGYLLSLTLRFMSKAKIVEITSVREQL